MKPPATTRRRLLFVIGLWLEAHRVHTIRLRRPWLRSVGDQEPPTKVDVPDADLSAERCDSFVTYRRAFNRPSGLEPNDRVWLSIAKYTDCSIRVLLNDVSIFQGDTPQPLRIDITPHLGNTNQLVIQRTAEHQLNAVLDGEVTLQIES